MQFIITYGLQQRLVVFVNENHHGVTFFLKDALDNAFKALRQCHLIYIAAITLFPFREKQVEPLLQNFLMIILVGIEVEMQHRIDSPLFFQLLNGKSLEQFALTTEIGSHGGHQQRLTKPAGAAQEIIASIMSKTINQCGLVNIGIALMTDFLKILYSNRIFHCLNRYGEQLTLQSYIK